MEIRHDDRPAFLKLFLGPNAPKRWKAASTRLRQAAEVMGGENLVVRALVEVEECHALITTPAPGLPMQQVFLQADAAQRLTIVRRAGEWLHCLVHAREQRPFPSWKWHVKLVETASSFASDAAVDGNLVRGHMARMEQMARRLHLQPVDWGICHGDFHPENLFIAQDDGRLVMTGIDMEIADPIPVVRDLARMLVWLECAALPGPDRDSGIDRALFDSLCACHGPFTKPDRLALHFHIGEMLLEFYLRRGSRLPALRPKMKRALEDWANDALTDAGSL